MSNEYILPFLSEFDPTLRAEGSIDPLGLYPIADALGVRLASGVRERQSSPRFLTLALVGMAACERQILEAGEAKGVPAWLAYEWLVVAALVSAWRGTPKLAGIPGQDKVKSTLDAGDVVCHRSYLKTPSVFGFHGVYRVLGLKAGLFDAQYQPLASGWRVLQAWERERNLQGFITGEGPGRGLRQRIAAAIREGIAAEHVREPRGLRDILADCLDPHHPGPVEASVLWTALLDNDPIRREFAELIVAPEGQAAWQAARDPEKGLNEGMVLARIAEGASPLLGQLLEAVAAFEHLSRVLFDAWAQSLWHLTQVRRPVAPAELAAGDAVRDAARESGALLADASAAVGAVDPALRMRLESAFSWVGETKDPAVFVANLLRHHQRIQKAKPPAGKRAWFDEMTNGRVAVRPGYARDEFERQPGWFVNQYRVRPLHAFAEDLGQVPAAGQ
jgi:hypothetical protein